ncbi:MAG: dipeptidase [Woeseiaceae bacterium]|jgi:membrane dipeptidase
MTRMILAFCASLTLVSACDKLAPEPATTPEASDAQEAPDFAAAAQRIARESIIIDTHIDVPMRIVDQPQDVSVATDSGDFDYPRAVAGGLNAPFMSIYTAAELEAAGESYEMAETLIDAVEEMVANAPDKFAIARSPADVVAHFEQGIMSLPMGMENGSPIDGNLANLKHFYDRGIRYITLTHGLSNHLSDSSYDENHQWGGLSDFGVEVVKEMNRFGMMVDVSHVSDEAFWDVLEVSKAPVIASHSSARHFTPGWERNMSDDMIKALGEHGGVIQINFGSSFLTDAAREYDTYRYPAGEAWMKANPDKTYADLLTEWMPAYVAEHGPYPYATLDDVLDHIDHAVALAGIDHVGIGSDYDGVGDSLPVGLKDVSSYPNLIEGLLARGYSEDDIKKILGGNLLRVWEEVEARAVKKQE